MKPNIYPTIGNIVSIYAVPIGKRQTFRFVRDSGERCESK